ncbi:MAG: DUF2752 domain-containing protein [Dysgonamonadaceae bacterium]|jgi:hypothetical protein|nr:DUF2752 domain-containing protein [Dysgonamonadaceae bacterium]
MENFIAWLREHLLTCPSRDFLHIDCPGCGLQRSVVALLEGDFVGSFKLYPATLPLIFTLLFTVLHLKFDFKHGALIIKWSYILTVTLIFAFYIHKIITHKIF